MVSAGDKPDLITKDRAKPGTILVDGGLSVEGEGNMVGDISDCAKKKMSGIYFPVPMEYGH